MPRPRLQFFRTMGAALQYVGILEREGFTKANGYEVSIVRDGGRVLVYLGMMPSDSPGEEHR